MAVDYRFKFPLPNGLHARPASHFEAVTSRFRSKITLISERTRVHANARSVLSMVSADVKYDDPCCIEVDGEDEQPALDAVRRFVHDELPHCDHQLPELPAEISDLQLPRSLTAAGLTTFTRGRAVSGGVGWGKIVMIHGMQIPAGLENERSTDSAFEKQRARDAIARVAQSIRAKIDAATVPHEAEVLRSHLSIVRDVALEESINTLIASDRRTAAQAIVEACRIFSDTLRHSDSAYLRERILDIEDVCLQLLDQVVHREHRAAGPVLAGPSVCVADHLTPGQLLGLNRKHLRGLVLSEGGTTSHTVILARSINVPTLVGVADATGTVRSGTEAIVDGELGLLVTDLSEPIRRYYTLEQDRLDRWRQKLDAYRTLDGTTEDGHAIEIGANIASAEEAAAAFQNGAQGIGLFRTEMLFMDRTAAPSETDQTQIYTAAVSAGQGRPVIIRLLDIGGDKPAPYLELPDEENPFLGYRGARLYREFSSLVKCQLRAILRAHASGCVKILVPMICCLEEVREIRQILNECADELNAEGLQIGPLPPLGVMVEVPSLAFLMPELCREVDFFSIGSNDLTQYFLAADRSNQKIASLYTWSHPAFLRLLKSVIDSAKSHGKWIGLCGELGDQPAALPLLVGLGLDEISVSPARVNSVKASVSKLRYSHCQALVTDVLSRSTRSEVESMVQDAIATAGTAPILSPDLILNVDCQSKEEVIKRLSDQLFLSGRTSDPKLLEQAIWKREETYSTGFGFGCALPHCKSDHLAANSIVIARLADPVDWVSLDKKPVDLVMLLALRGQAPAREHMKTFARLSRLVMREEFRDRLRNEADHLQLVEFLQSSLSQDPSV